VTSDAEFVIEPKLREPAPERSAIMSNCNV
jgi:hypothetical protein